MYTVTMGQIQIKCMEDWFPFIKSGQLLESSRVPNHTPPSTTAGPTRLSHFRVTAVKPAYLCDNIFLQIQVDICIFQGEDTLLHSYIWDNSWLHSHKTHTGFDFTLMQSFAHLSS